MQIYSFRARIKESLGYFAEEMYITRVNYSRGNVCHLSKKRRSVAILFDRFSSSSLYPCSSIWAQTRISIRIFSRFRWDDGKSVMVLRVKTGSERGWSVPRFKASGTQLHQSNGKVLCLPPAGSSTGGCRYSAL